MQQWQCTVQTSELLCQIQKFDLESSSRKGSQHVTFIWSAGQNYSTNSSDGRACQSAQRDETQHSKLQNLRKASLSSMHAFTEISQIEAYPEWH